MEFLPKVYSLVRDVRDRGRDVVLSRRQRSAAGAVPGRSRVRRRPDHARGRLRVLQRVAELADRRAVVPGDRSALSSGPPSSTGGASRRPVGRDSAPLRAAPRRPAHRGQVHHARPARHRGQRPHGWRSCRRDRARGVGGRPRRGHCPRRAGTSSECEAEPQATSARHSTSCWRRPGRVGSSRSRCRRSRRVDA
jgi:hypothetical protein